MPLPSDAGPDARAMAKLFKVLLPPSFRKLRISDELAGCFSAGGGGGEGAPDPTALVVSPFGKVWRVEVGRDGDGAYLGCGWAEFLAAHGVDLGWFVVLRHEGGGTLTVKVFDTSMCIKEFGSPAAGGWSQFLEFHGISNGDILLLRYEGNMVFKFKAFGINGCQKDFKNQNAGIQLNTERQETPSIRKHKSNDERSSSEENKRPKSSVTYPTLKESYQIGTPSWIRKKISTYMLESHLMLSKKFCNSIGFQITCTIILKTEIDSTRSWQVRGAAYKGSCHITGEGWKTFCQDNRLKTGDLCTFNIIETKLWHVTITHSTLPDTFKKKKSPCSSSRDDNTNEGNSSSEGTKRPKSSMTSLSKVPSYIKSVYDIGPPSWIRKEMNTNSITQHLSLAQAFCHQIGLQECCTITLKTSVNSNSWQVRGQRWHKDSSCVFKSGWKKFCRENNVKVGDVCTFNVIKTTLWHVDITRH